MALAEELHPITAAPAFLCGVAEMRTALEFPDGDVRDGQNQTSYPSLLTHAAKGGRDVYTYEQVVRFPYGISSRGQLVLSVLASSIRVPGAAARCTVQIDFTLMNASLSDGSVLPNTLFQPEVILDSFKIASNVFFCPVIPLINGQWKIESTLQHIKAEHEGCQKNQH